MAASNINFSQDGQDYISDPISVTAENIVVRVNFEKQGAVHLERSIDGAEPFVFENFFCKVWPDLDSVERNISNIKPGQVLKLRFKNCKPSKILVLQ